MCACSPQITVSFDAIRPWRAEGEVKGYERLNYDVCVYDTTNGVAHDKRVQIASGSLVFVLDEDGGERDNVSYSYIETSIEYNYNSSAPEQDRGLTDKISSRVEFATNSLDTSYAEKTVDLARRGDADNLSYTLTADYFGKHEAKFKYTKQENAEERTISIPNGTYNDNEMMYFLARATTLADGASSNFYMTNIFEAFSTGKLTKYTMQAQVTGTSVLDFGGKSAEWGVEAVTDDAGNVSYPMACLYTSIIPSIERHGPPHFAFYSAKPLKDGDKAHSKVPVKFIFNEYAGTALARTTEYTLQSFSFKKPV